MAWIQKRHIKISFDEMFQHMMSIDFKKCLRVSQAISSRRLKDRIFAHHTTISITISTFHYRHLPPKKETTLASLVGSRLHGLHFADPEASRIRRMSLRFAPFTQRFLLRGSFAWHTRSTFRTSKISRNE